jgi:hypothetical protein
MGHSTRGRLEILARLLRIRNRLLAVEICILFRRTSFVKMYIWTGYIIRSPTFEPIDQRQVLIDFDMVKETITCMGSTINIKGYYERNTSSPLPLRTSDL